MYRQALLFALVAAASAFQAGPLSLRPAAHSVVAARAATAPTMLVEPTTAVDAASNLLALSIPIPEFQPAKAFIMMFSNVLVICSMRIDGKGLAVGTPHDEMVESFGLTWLLAGTSLGHIVGAGAILGCSSAGFF